MRTRVCVYDIQLHVADEQRVLQVLKEINIVVLIIKRG